MASQQYHRIIGNAAEAALAWAGPQEAIEAKQMQKERELAIVEAAIEGSSGGGGGWWW